MRWYCCGFRSGTRLWRNPCGNADRALIPVIASGDGSRDTAPDFPERARQEVEAALQSGDLFRYHSKNAPVTLLEQEFADMMGSRFALAVASCSAALFLSLRALDLPKGAKVLIPGFTFAAVPSAVVHAECTPVLVEVGENYRMDMRDFEEKSVVRGIWKAWAGYPFAVVTFNIKAGF